MPPRDPFHGTWMQEKCLEPPNLPMHTALAGVHPCQVLGPSAVAQEPACKTQLGSKEASPKTWAGTREHVPQPFVLPEVHRLQGQPWGHILKSSCHLLSHSPAPLILFPASLYPDVICSHVLVSGSALETQAKTNGKNRLCREEQQHLLGEAEVSLVQGPPEVQCSGMEQSRKQAEQLPGGLACWPGTGPLSRPTSSSGSKPDCTANAIIQDCIQGLD